MTDVNRLATVLIFNKQQSGLNLVSNLLLFLCKFVDFHYGISITKFSFKIRYVIKHIVGFVDFILNKQATHLHFFHSYVLFKIKLGLYEDLAFLLWFGTENYTSVYTRLALYAIIYGIIVMLDYLDGIVVYLRYYSGDL